LPCARRLYLPLPLLSAIAHHRPTIMAPISPISQNRKRPSPSESDDDRVDDASSKKRRIESNASQTPELEHISLPTPPEAELFDEKPRKLLSRAVALALEHVGFEGASREAMEAMCDEVDICQY
jgi:transcription initiation factor TFIID subunit 8